MDIERLEQLREETAQYRAVADDLCMDTQYEDDLLALIDAELARQSVTDEAVQRARQWFWDEFLTGHMCIPEEAKTILSVLDNLRQMRTEPCEYCDGKQKYKRIDDTHSWNIMKFTNGHCHMKVWEDNGSNFMRGISFDIDNCPNCGRKLVKHDG